MLQEQLYCAPCFKYRLSIPTVNGVHLEYSYKRHDNTNFNSFSIHSLLYTFQFNRRSYFFEEMFVKGTIIFAMKSAFTSSEESQVFVCNIWLK